MFFGNLDGYFYAFHLKTGDLKWAFHVGADAQALNFVYGKGRIFLFTSAGLFCLGQDPKKRKAAPGFILRRG
ncbi:MAG: hypothetical protein ACYTHM_03235 [Planctomycetota bacterium]|jgi:outer membrane protein assembly factor BamB